MTDGSQHANPYVGLRPFDHSDSLYFFGRRTQVSDLLQQLHETRFLAVVGSSGCGKSSLIRAGLIPALLGGFLVQERDRWLVGKMKPGGGPLGNLAQALCALDGREPEPGAVSKLEEAIAEHHVEAVTDHLKERLGSNANVLLLLDQFEEIFNFRGTDADESVQGMGRTERQDLMNRRREADDFVDLVLALADQKDVPVYIVLTMRSDFLGDCDLFYRLPEAMNLSRYLVPRLDRAQLREAIEGPAMLTGNRLAPRLVDALLNELGDRSDRLPILQHALMRTWDFWRKAGGEGDIDLEHYSAAGTLQEALPRHANEALGPDRQLESRIFKCLTDTDLNHRRVRRAAPLAELAAVAGVDRSVVEAILARFNDDGRNFLVISSNLDSGETQAEISHESLIRQWDLLAQWVDEERESRDQFWELVDRGRKGRALLRDPDLQTALNWREAAQPSQIWARRYSHEASDFGLAMEYLDRSHQARKKATQRRRRARNRAVAVTGLVGIALAGLAVWALDNAGRARDMARVAIASNWLDRDPTLAGLVLLEVRSPARTRFATPTMRSLFDRPFARAILRGHAGPLSAIAFSPDGARIVTASDDGTARVWNSNGLGEPVVLRGHEGGIRTVAFAGDGTRVVTAGDDATARVWRVDGSGESIVLRGHEDVVTMVRFSPDSQRVVTASVDTTARLWSADGSGEPVILRGHEGPVPTVEFSPDGAQVLTASEDGTARVWDARGEEAPRVFAAHDGSVASAVYDTEGARFATASADGTAKVWNADGSGEPVTLSSSDMTLCETVAFSRDGSKVVVGGSSSRVQVFEADGSRRPITLLESTGFGFDGALVLYPAATAFSPDNRLLAVGAPDGMVQLYSASGTGEPIELRGHTGRILQMAFSPDASLLATASDDGTARIWSMSAPDEPSILAGHDDRIRAAAFSPDGSRVVTASDDGTARVWAADGSAEPVVLRGHDDTVTAATFSRDGLWILTGAADGTARVWPSNGSGDPVVLEGHEGSLTAAGFSPDGKRVVTADDRGTARVWSADGSGDPVVLEGHSAAVTDAGFSADGARVVTGAKDDSARVWNADGSGEPIVLLGHEGPVEAACFGPHGKRILTASGDRTARVWNADGSGEPRVLEHDGWVTSAVFSTDGERVVTASDDKLARVWSADDPTEPVLLRGHSAQLVSAAFNPDGTRVVTASMDQTARVWNADGAGEPLVLRGHDARLSVASFSPDGARILTASRDGTARVWAYTPALLQGAIASWTHACLDASFREVHLNESAGDARRAYERCQDRLERTP